jgi:hypothetical protein
VLACFDPQWPVVLICAVPYFEITRTNYIRSIRIMFLIADPNYRWGMEWPHIAALVLGILVPAIAIAALLLL